MHRRNEDIQGSGVGYVQRRRIGAPPGRHDPFRHTFGCRQVNVRHNGKAALFRHRCAKALTQQACTTRDDNNFIAQHDHFFSCVFETRA
jgi:hypothetical protein